MKRILVFLFFFQFCFIALMAQSSNMPALDKSPMDMCYYPVNYPVQKIQDKITEPLVARVIYSRPKKDGRQIPGSLVEYGKVWRLGANEATEIEFFKHVRINGKKLSKGRYTIFAIVNESSWTFIINKETDTWGSFKYDEKKDVVRITVPIQKTNDIVENLAMIFEKSTAGINLVVAWDQVKAALPITYY